MKNIKTKKEGEREREREIGGNAFCSWRLELTFMAMTPYGAWIID